jgi:hypothetical protein
LGEASVAEDLLEDGGLRVGAEACQLLVALLLDLAALHYKKKKTPSRTSRSFATQNLVLVSLSRSKKKLVASLLLYIEAT